MASDSYREVTSRSWFSRIGGAVKGIVVGLVLIAGAVGLLFWNEGRAVERYKTLKEGGGVVLSVDSSSVNPANEGKLVHMTGRADTEDVLRDPEFGVAVTAIRLHREVEMYQWKESQRSETRKKLGGGEETVTTYEYDTTWSERVIDSGSFKKPAGHGNPTHMAYSSVTATADRVQVGGFILPGFLVQELGDRTPLVIESDAVLLPGSSGPVHRQRDGFYLGEDPGRPKVGDLRISYSVVLPTDVSLVARQVANSFEPYRAEAGGSLAMLETGIHAADTMFKKAHQSNTVMTWVLRIGGFIVMTLGLSMILGPLVVLADVVPAIGSIIGAGTKLISALLAGLLSFITIGIAWFFYRPLLGSVFLAVAVALGVVIFRKMKSAEPAVVPPVPPATPPPVPGS